MRRILLALAIGLTVIALPSVTFAISDEETVQQNLGIFYRDGRGGLTMDDREAARLLRLAADQGNANARTALNQITQQTSQEASTAPNAPLKQEAVEPGPAPAANLPAVPERRVALVIGNSAYQTVGGLPTTPEEATATAA